jgi:hypothetical protein
MHHMESKFFRYMFKLSGVVNIQFYKCVELCGSSKELISLAEMVSLNHSLERLLLREINVVAMGSFMLHFFKFMLLNCVF